MKRGLVSDGVLEWAVRTPERVAIVLGSETITYGQLARRIQRVASAVDAVAARRVAVSLPNHTAVLELFFGVTLAGAVFVVFEPKWPRETLDAMLKTHQPDLFFGDGLGEGGISLNQYSLWRDQHDPRALVSQPTPEMPFLIGFTSGTTGIPKAFIRAHASWTASFAASRIEFGTDENTHVVLPGPLSHGLSLYSAVETLNAGGSVTIEPTFDAARLMSITGAGRVNTIVAAPTLLDLMIDGAAPISTISCITTAGAKLSPALRLKLQRVFPRARIIEYYGASELSFVSVARSDENCPLESVGRAFQGVEIKIVDGVVWVKSAMLSHGYVGPTDGSGFRVDEDWATVGDRGSLDARGFLTLIGRDGDMIITGGLNVYPAEVEAVVADIPGVNEIFVTGEPDERWGQVVTAVIATTSHIHIKLLQQACAQHLTPHKHPRRWYVINAFKHTASGKIDRADVLGKLRSKTLKALA